MTKTKQTAGTPKAKKPTKAEKPRSPKITQETTKPAKGKAKAKPKASKPRARNHKPRDNMGATCSYTVEVGNTICQRLIELGSLRKVCEAEDMPSKATVFNWLLKSDCENPDPVMTDFRDQYARARRLSKEFQFDEHWQDVEKTAYVPVLIDDVPLIIDGKPVMQVTTQSVQLARLKHDAWKWQASKEDPKKYGDKITQEVVGANGGAVKVETLAATVDQQTASDVYQRMIRGE